MSRQQGDRDANSMAQLKKKQSKRVNKQSRYRIDWISTRPGGCIKGSRQAIGTILMDAPTLRSVEDLIQCHVEAAEDRKSMELNSEFDLPCSKEAKETRQRQH